MAATPGESLRGWVERMRRRASASGRTAAPPPPPAAAPHTDALRRLACEALAGRIAAEEALEALQLDHDRALDRIARLEERLARADVQPPDNPI
ncbi:hypothetical protein [Azospirillum halopraeferens]|uniref:hypothetical protein n=1 Tax=Azospirillum halopraeferens TaxID=34010 RepID=UPI000491A5D4|nr:hypothetical protein [Azospirillum halopraeferens]